MKAVILSAGQGKRLLPLTKENPKCLLNCEVDFPADLKQAQKVVRTFSSSSPDKVDCQFRYAVG